MAKGHQTIGTKEAPPQERAGEMTAEHVRPQEKTATSSNAAFPTEDQMAAFGAFSYLVWRAGTQDRLPIHYMRETLMPPIMHGFYHLFYQGHIPRAGLTWALLSDEAQERFTSGQGLRREDWASGPNLWFVDGFAPFGNGSGRLIGRWACRSLAPEVTRFCFMRSYRGGPVSRIVQADRRTGGWSFKSVPYQVPNTT